jgi:hypothetical protein
VAVRKKLGLALAVLVLAAAVGFAGLIWLTFDYQTRAALFGPDHATSTVLPDGTRLTAELVNTSPLGATEYERTLKIETAAESLTIRMFDDWGPARRTSIYLTENGSLVVLGPAHDDYFVSLRPLRRLQAPAQSDSSRWAYVGAFDLATTGVGRDRRTVLRFFSSAQQAECVPTFMDSDEGGPFRKHAYASSC